MTTPCHLMVLTTFVTVNDRNEALGK